jgi:transcriptional regulator with XRE-family HTH domain
MIRHRTDDSGVCEIVVRGPCTDAFTLLQKGYLYLQLIDCRRIVYFVPLVHSAQGIPDMDTRQHQNVPATQIFSQRLAEVRGSRSKRAFSKEIGINSPQTYQHYENGRVPDIDTLSRIATHCGVTVDWLLGRDQRSLSELVDSPVHKLQKGEQKQETAENIGYSELVDSPVHKLQKGRGVREDGVAYGLEGELSRMRARMDGVEEELTHMRTQLDTVVGLLGAALGNGIRDKQDDRKAG